MNELLEMFLSSEHLERTVFENHTDMTRRITTEPQAQVSYPYFVPMLKVTRSYKKPEP